MAVHLSWSPNNDNFDGFEVYRGTTLLGEVLRGDALIWSDEEGLPGLLTVYAVRAFKTGDINTQYSDYTHVSTEFPILAPIEYLTATQIVGENKLLLAMESPV